MTPRRFGQPVSRAPHAEDEGKGILALLRSDGPAARATKRVRVPEVSTGVTTVARESEVMNAAD